MLEQINLTKKMEKSVYQEKMEVMEPQLAKLQRECKALGIPVIIVFEGVGASGKGLQISKLIYPLDPGDFRFLQLRSRQRKRRCTPFYGGSGQKLRKKAALQFLIQAGTERFLWTGLRIRFPGKN